MTSSPENSEGFYLQENFTYSRNKESLDTQMNEVYQKMARASNAKEIGIYEETEVLTGQRFPGANPQTKQSVYRKLFIFGAIATGASLNITHGISSITALTHLYGTFITDVIDHRSLPYVDVTNVTSQTGVLLAGANITISNGAGAPNITSGYVIAEYIK